MTYKPWYRSVSIVGLLAGFAGSVANYFHANISDLVPVLNADLGTYLNDTVALAGVIGSIVARCREAHAVTLTKKSAARKNLAAALAVPAAGSGAVPASQAPTAAVAPQAAVAAPPGGAPSAGAAAAHSFQPESTTTQEL